MYSMLPCGICDCIWGRCHWQTQGYAGESFTSALDWYLLSYQQTLSAGVVKLRWILYCFCFNTNVHYARKFHRI